MAADVSVSRQGTKDLKDQRSRLRFEHPTLLYLLLLWPALLLLGINTLAWRGRAAAKLGEAGVLDRLYSPSTWRWRLRRIILVLTATGLLMIAAARPQYGRIERTITSAGTNVIVAIDVSPSMKARDVQPERMTFAKNGLKLLLNRLTGQRVGIVVFSGQSVLQCPMTLDQAMLRLVIESLDTDSISIAGTDIGAAIETTVKAFENDGSAGGRNMILITDGEDNEGKGLAAAREAAKKKVTIYAIAIGTRRGAPVPAENGLFRSGVTSAMNLGTLEAIAKATGGKALEAGNSPESAIAAIGRAIDVQEKAELEERHEVIHQERYQWFLLPGIALLLWAILSTPNNKLITKS